jgi:hypothetical protein
MSKCPTGYWFYFVSLGTFGYCHHEKPRWHEKKFLSTSLGLYFFKEPLHHLELLKVAIQSGAAYMGS